MSDQTIIEGWLTETYDYAEPKQGEIREGILLDINEQWAIIDVGLKHDGIVPREDMERLEQQTLSHLKPGQEVMARVLQPQDTEGRLLLSLSYFQEAKDWAKARTMLENDTIWQGQASGFNRGGLLVKFGHLTGFIPASHLSRSNKSFGSDKQPNAWLKELVGQKFSLKVIEVDQEANRLVLSERLARDHNRAALLAELSPGQVRRGIVQNIVNFGAFVDLGGIDGLLHISELAWRRIRHPSEVVQVGDEVQVYVLNVDHDRERINLSLKHLEPNPWDQIDQIYETDQVVTGTVTNVVDFGAFVLLDTGVEGLLHISEIADPVPHDPREFIERGDELRLRILRIDLDRQQMRLSLKQVDEAAPPMVKQSDEPASE